MLLGLMLALSTLVGGGLVLFDARNEVWERAESASNNLALALARDIARNITIFDLSIQTVRNGLHLPGIDQVTPEVRHAALFDGSISAEYLGHVIITDKAGTIIEASTAMPPGQKNIADSGYFQALREHPNSGMYISDPFRGRWDNGEPFISIARPIVAPDGSFNGIVAGALRLAYFDALFASLDVGPHGSVTVFHTDGRMIARAPNHSGEFDRDISHEPNFLKFKAVESGDFVSTARTDGVSRLYAVRRVGTLPLMLTIARSVDDIYAPWKQKAIVIAIAMAGMFAASIGLSLLFRHELVRRVQAEAELVDASEELKALAATDGLTGLDNRRTFDAKLDREWRRAIRAQLPISLVMLDADAFKLFNDSAGHQRGDAVLQEIANCIRQGIRRPGDTGARYGGEEFAVILPATDLAGASHIAEIIRRAVVALQIDHPDGISGVVTVSLGVASKQPVAGETLDSLIGAADEALYDAKRRGRNRVSTAPLDSALAAD